MYCSQSCSTLCILIVFFALISSSPMFDAQADVSPARPPGAVGTHPGIAASHPDNTGTALTERFKARDDLSTPSITTANHKRTPPHPVNTLNLQPGWIMIYASNTAFIPIQAAATALLSLYDSAYAKAVLWTIRQYDPEARRMTIVFGSLRLTFSASKAFPELSTFVALFTQRMIIQTLAGYTGRYWIEILSPAGPDRVRIQVVLSVIGDHARNIGTPP